MKIDRADGICVIQHPEVEGCTGVPEAIVHALIRLGMEHQRERDAKFIASLGTDNHRSLGGRIRADARLAITATDIEAAIGEGE